MADTVWYYTPVSHDGFVAVHSAEYAEDGTLVSVDSEQQDLTDLSVEHLVNFVAQVALGITNKPMISAADYAAKVRRA